MNKSLKILFCIACFTGIGSSFAAVSTYGYTFFSQRPQWSNLPRQWVGVTDYLFPCDCDFLNGYLSCTPEFTRSFDRDEIGKFLFYNGTNMMTFGSAGGTGVDVFARNFFLNDNFNGTLTALPRVENFIFDIQFRLNLDEWLPGLYFDIHGPINWTQWSVNFNEDVITSGTAIAQYALGNTTAFASPINSILAAYNGQTLDPTDFPNLKEILQYGRVDTSDANNGSTKIRGAQTKISLADVETALGYSFLCNDSYHFAVDFRVVFPASNRPTAIFLFEPIAGNGNHYEVGGGTSAHYEFWNNCCDSSFSIWAEGTFYTVLKSRQRRLFDLANADGTQNIGSSRLLIKQFTGAPTAPALNQILFGPNVLALHCKVSNALHAEAMVLFDYYRCGFMLDAGYNLWARTQDKITDIDIIPPNTYGLAGQTLGTGGSTANNTGSTAQINGTGGAADLTNVYISNEQLYIGSAANPTALSHKFFAHANYAWENCDYTPFVGLGGEVEFSGSKNSALDQWGIWIKGGFAFS